MLAESVAGSAGTKEIESVPLYAEASRFGRVMQRLIESRLRTVVERKVNDVTTAGADQMMVMTH